MKVVQYYDDPLVAEVAKGALESAGITAAVLNQSSVYPGLSVASSQFRIKLVVNEEDYDKAVEILSHDNSDSVEGAETADEKDGKES
jgi:acyl transferase domain-containing protein